MSLERPVNGISKQFITITCMALKYIFNTWK